MSESRLVKSRSTRPLKISVVIASLMAVPAASALDLSGLVGGVLTSVEVYHYQVGASSTVVKNYNAFDETFSEGPEFDLTSLSLSIGGGQFNPVVSHPDYPGVLKARQDFEPDALNDMLTARPIATTYTYALNSNVNDTITNTGPGSVSFAQGLPVTPVFTFSVPGIWSLVGNRIAFVFNPTGVTSFTATLNGYDATVRGGHYEYRYSVRDLTDDFTKIDDGGDFAEDATLADPIQLAFFQGSAVDNGDLDPTTFGFVDGSRFEIEGEFFNHFDFDIDQDGILSSYVFGNVTSVLIVAAVPEPSAAASLAGLAALGLAGLRRRRRA
jgi:hypothetical protein